MRNPTRTILNGILVLLALLLTTACTASVGSESAATNESTPSFIPGYFPQSGDEVLIFTHRFNPEDYEEGKRIVYEDFSAAIQASGQMRRTYFLNNPDDAEFIVISLFHTSSSTEDWLADPVREEILSKLRPLYREPLQIDLLTVEDVHDTHSVEQ
jgi:hypothetical protein